MIVPKLIIDFHLIIFFIIGIVPVVVLGVAPVGVLGVTSFTSTLQSKTDIFVVKSLLTQNIVHLTAAEESVVYISKLD